MTPKALRSARLKASEAIYVGDIESSSMSARRSNRKFGSCDFIFARYLLFFLYGTYEGINFIRFLLVVCLLQYIQSPLNICLDATNRSKYVLYGSINSPIFLQYLSYINSVATEEDVEADA